MNKDNVHRIIYYSKKNNNQEVNKTNNLLS